VVASGRWGPVASGFLSGGCRGRVGRGCWRVCGAGRLRPRTGTMAPGAGHVGLASGGRGWGRRRQAWVVRGGPAASRDGDDGAGCEADRCEGQWQLVPLGAGWRQG
jgi:hypothetical protein